MEFKLLENVDRVVVHSVNMNVSVCVCDPKINIEFFPFIFVIVESWIPRAEFQLYMNKNIIKY